MAFQPKQLLIFQGAAVGAASARPAIAVALLLVVSPRQLRPYAGSKLGEQDLAAGEGALTMGRTGSWVAKRPDPRKALMLTERTQFAPKFEENRAVRSECSANFN